MANLLVIIGITGHQGSSIASHFLTLPNWSIRGLTRSPSSPSALLWASKGVSIVHANLDDPSSLDAAFEGATAIFSITDFWNAFYHPGTQGLLKEGQSLGEFCKEKEYQQGKHVADAASRVIGLRRFMVSSLVDATQSSGGKYTGVYHWDGKGAAVRYIRDVYPDLAAKMDVVIVGNYMGNWMTDIKFRKQEDGTYRVGLVGSGLIPLPQIDIQSDLGTIVHAAVQTPPGKSILAASDMVSWSEQLRTWCEVNQVKFGWFDELEIEVFDRFFPIPGLGRELGEMMAFMHEFGYVGGDESVLLPWQLGVPCPLTSWEEFVKRQDWSHVLNA